MNLSSSLREAFFVSKLPTVHEPSIRLCEERSDVAIQQGVWIATRRSGARNDEFTEESSWRDLSKAMND